MNESTLAALACNERHIQTIVRKASFAFALLSMVGISVIAQRQPSGFHRPVVPPSVAVSATSDTSSEIIAKGFLPNEYVDITVYERAPFATRKIVLANWTAIAGVDGAITANWAYPRTLGSTFAVVRGRSTGVSLTANLSAPPGGSYSLEQCRNGTVAAPLTCTGANWVNGNLNASQAHYREGESVPYRLIFDGLDTSVTHTLTIEYDSTAGGHHAMDYLMSFDRSENTAEPCDGIAGCDPLVHSHVDIPLDPAVAAGQDGIGGTGDDVVQAPGQFTLFGGTILTVSGYTVMGDVTANSSTAITITFTATAPSPAFAWSSHIATRHDWGVGNSAMEINGSPFHMRIEDFDGRGGGGQERGVAGDAVYYPGTIVVYQDTRPHTFVTDFWFDSAGPLTSGFWLDDDGDPLIHYSDTQAFNDLIGFGSANQYVFTQTSPAPYILQSVNCTSDPQGGTGTNNNIVSLATRQLTVNLEEGELVTCTFVNTLAPTAAGVSVSGRVRSSDGSGVRGVRVLLTDPDGRTTSVLTNAFGYYTFTAVASGQAYVLNASSRNFRFAARVLPVNDALNGVDLTALP